MINVTKTFLPPIDEYQGYLNQIWESGWLTNFGPISVNLENELKKYLGVKHLFFVSNGTVALQIAIKALGLKGDIITTPFSYIATASSIVWEGCKPVFVDIDKDSLNLDPSKIEQAITNKTEAIIATHVFGNPCDVVAIENIAKKRNLKIIYDAAHAFGVEINNKSILSCGDISTISFHSTKLFHTIEGGAIITNDDDLANKIFYLRNFGHSGAEHPEEFIGLGINGKNSEFHAAMGLCLLPRVEDLINRRRELSELYDEFLIGFGIDRPLLSKNTKYNFAYYPVIFPSMEKMMKVKKVLNELGVNPRRYFYPSLNKVEYIEEINKQIMPVSEDIASRILCLPLYYDLKKEEVEMIAKTIKASL